MHTELLCAGGEPPAILVRLCDVRTLPPTPVLIEKAERLIPAEEVFSALRYRQDPDKRMALASRLLQQQLLRQHSSRHRDSRAVCSPSFLSDAQPSHASQRRSLSHTLSCNSKAPQQHEILSSAPAASSPPLSSPSPCAASPYSSSATSGSAAAFSAAPSACISVDSAAAPPPLASSASALSGAPSQVCSAASSADSCAHLSANGASHPALSVAGGTRPLNVPEKVERQRSGQKPLWLPRLGEESPFVHFNVSHDNSLVVLAASRLLVGVDCMQLKVRGAANRSVADFLRAMRTQCVGRERAYVFGEGDALPESEQLMRFMKLWTMKEAFVKAIGTGV
ncbi:hypothetical protein BESB_035580 [Besnoitia besnoiti]|uniref:holo-[acyl-carrier-protein] synthase n=1 Tax=Besnoitia besnoiti TaxID=94643 RepID=A0A2A9MN71_BESBE|nr:hypothetical protein BESB_035580 [Besnoitia besnoiti]PFH37100.1 hypothetical protein BESB_035580 [Besnoitia besnoiti]